MKLADYMNAAVTAITAATNRDGDPIFKDVGTHGKVFGATELGNLMMVSPACRIALVGSRGGITQVSRSTTARAIMGRADVGSFRGPLQMMGFLVERDWQTKEARDRVIELVDEFMYWLEHQTFGLTTEQAGPAQITGFDILYSAEIDERGAAIGAVTWEQEVWFGRNLHDEDLALLTGDKDGLYPSGQEWYTEKEWADAGVIDPDTQGPIVDAGITKHFTGETESEEDQPTELDADGSFDDTGRPEE